MQDRQRTGDRREDALRLLEEAALGLTGNGDLLACLRKYRLALRILGWDEGWVAKELEGYPPEEGPSWRLVRERVAWKGAGDPVAGGDTADFHVRLSVGELYAYRSEGCYMTVRSDQNEKGESVPGAATLTSRSIDRILHRIAERLMDLVSADIVRLKYGEVVETVFRSYQGRVSQAMSDLGLEDHLKNAYENLQGGSEASWQTAALACRNTLQALADRLYQVAGDTYPYLRNGMRVTSNEPRNRLWAYMHQKGLGMDSVVACMVEPLYSDASAGKIGMTYQKAQSVLINTYVFIGELALRTGMEPITELRQP